MNSTEKPSILYVDDEQANLSAFKFEFRRFYNINLALSGEQGLEIVKQGNIDVAISDQRMPEMTGVEFLERLATQYPLVGRILVTAYSDIGAIIQAINQAKVSCYISKPWNGQYFKSQIDNAVEVRRLKFENEQLILDLNRQNLQLKEHSVEREQMIVDLQQALDKVKQLSGLLPICANCHKIRNDEGYWQRLEIYFMEHSDTRFSHGICPDCRQKLYPGL